MTDFRLPKQTKLCSTATIDRLFSRRSGGEAHNAIVYPLRAVWAPAKDRADNHHGLKFVISVPKKRLKLAVDRVTMRRRIRECYRLNRRDREDSCPNVDVVFIYVADKLVDSTRINTSIKRLLTKITGIPEKSDQIVNQEQQ